MAEVKWIKMATNIWDNRKIVQIESLPDGDTIIVIWLKLLCLAGTTNDSGMVYFTKEIPYTEQMLATLFNRPLATIQFALKVFQEFEMISIIDDFLQISNWKKYQKAATFWGAPFPLSRAGRKAMETTYIGSEGSLGRRFL